MKVISENNEILKSEVSLAEIDSIYGLIMESRSGAKGTPQERNIDYLTALNTVVQRLKDCGVDNIRVYVVSAALTEWSMEQKALAVDGNTIIDIRHYDARLLGSKLSRAQEDKKKDPRSKGGNPTKRILINADIGEQEWLDVILGSSSVPPISEQDLNSSGASFNPRDAEEVKEKVTRAIAVRRGQPRFRKNLLKAYSGKCAVTESEIEPLLEAAHIVPYQGNNTNHITNGILLRSDIHTLFDLGLLGVNGSYEVVVCATLKDTEYYSYHGKRVSLPSEKREWPSVAALKTRPLPR